MNPYLRTSLLFGSIAGLGSILYFLVLQYLVKEPGLARLGSWEILFTLVCMLYAMGYYRDRKQGGILHFWQGALLGISTALISTTLLCVFVFWVVRVADPVTFKEFILYMQKDMLNRISVEKDAALQKVFRAQLASLPSITPFNQIFFPGGIFVKNFGIEILVTGMIAAIMRKNVSHLTSPAPVEPKKKK